MCLDTYSIGLRFSLLTYLLTHSMKQSPSSEDNRFSVSQEIRRILWKTGFLN